MSQGWISLHRKMRDNWLWRRKPFSYGQAWIDLLLNANHTDGHIWVRDIQIEIKRGQVGWSEQRLAAEWGWSRSAVRTFLKRLKTEHQIEQQKNNITTVVTILNYEQYQKQDSKLNHNETAAGQQQDSSETLTFNDNNDNNGKECKYSPTSNEVRLSELLFSLIRQRKSDFKKPNFQSWAGCIDKMIRIDKRTPERIEAVIRWVQKDNGDGRWPGWQNNVLSTAKLREQFDKLEFKMMGAKNGKMYRRDTQFLSAEQQSDAIVL